MKIEKKDLQIAIDGLVATGKSTVARRLAQKLGVLYVYTGAMYRVTAYLAYNNDLKYSQEDKILNILKNSNLELLPAQGFNYPCRVLLDNKDVTNRLFTPEISRGSSEVARLFKIRKYLVSIQRNIINGHAVVIEGRDIAQTVLPNADLKVYMDADIKVRAKRRFLDLKEHGFSQSLESVLKDTKKRDYVDTHRKADPLRKLDDSWVLDTTDLSIEEVVNAIMKEMVERGLLSM